MKKLAAKNEQLEEEKKASDKKDAEKKAANKKKKKELETKPKVQEQPKSRRSLNEKDYSDRPEITLTLLDQYKMSKES